MYVSKQVLLTLVILIAGLAGAALRGMLNRDARAPATVAPAPQPLIEASVDDRATVPITVSIGRERPAAAEPAPMMFKLMGAAVSLTVVTSGPRTGVDPGQPQYVSYSDVHRTNASPPALHPFRSVATGRTRQDESPDSSEPEPPIHRLASTRRSVDSGQTPAHGTSQVILAYDGSIVFIGPGGRLTANTGASSASGTIAVGVKASTLATGTSAMPTSPIGRLQRQPVDALSRVNAFLLGISGTTGRRQMPANTVGPPRRQPVDALSHANASLLGLFPPEGRSGGRGVALSGFEDHSVSVIGDDQIVTYDDSNVFIERQGKINANTGDTDSSGLNAVDVTHSRVRSGNSGDAEQSGDDEGDNAKGSDKPDEQKGSPDGEAGPRPRQRSGVRPSIQLRNGQSMATVADEGASTAIGNNAFVVGADGVDDVSIRSRGRRNLVTYDDSNVIIGGKGKVNAQIGDSDTGGAVVMDIHHSDVEAGCEGDLCYSDVAPRGLLARTRPRSPASTRRLAGHDPRTRRSLPRATQASRATAP
jgi:hypothetical protein